MQIPPPSHSQFSLLSELFSPSSITNNEGHKDSGKVSPSMDVDPTKQKGSSFALRPSSSLAGDPGAAKTIRYQKQGQGGGALPVLRLQPQLQLQVKQQAQAEPNYRTPQKKMARRRSPSQKILRNPYNSSQQHPCRDERDENGNPQLPLPSSGPLTCFSYRTMEKEYEKDTQRMLERIQKSRSFERKGGRSPGQEEEEVGAIRGHSGNDAFGFNDENENDYHLQDGDSGFYIDDNEEEETGGHGCVAGGLTTRTIGDTLSLFEEEEEIFELDL